MRIALPMLAAGVLLGAPSAFADTDQAPAIRQALGKTLPLLQRSSDVLAGQTACATCHNHSQAIEAEMAAKAKGIAIDEAGLARQVATVTREIELRRDQAFLQGDMPGAHQALVGVLAGAIAGRAPASEATDAAAMYILAKQMPEGNWSTIARGSSGATNFVITAQAVQSIKAYAPPALKGEADASLAKARAWLSVTPASNNEGMVGRLNGLVWTRASGGEIAKARIQLVAAQQPNGGWAREPGRTTDAYATGASLTALKAGGMKTSDPVYRRGVDYLLKTQAADGSWYVKTLALPIQPPIERGFPYGMDQWLSAWGTALAATALAEALP